MSRVRMGLPEIIDERDRDERRRLGDEPSQKHTHWLLMVIIVLCVALAAVIGAGVFGYKDGVKDREERLRVMALEHYRAGVAHMEKGEYELAQAEFEEAIRLKPDLYQAWERLRESQIFVEAVPTPTSALLPTVMPTPISEELRVDLAAELEEARALSQAGRYMEAVEALQPIIQADPNFERAQIADLLYNCYYREALNLIEQDRLEEALRLLDQALSLRPDDTAAQTERELAAGYIASLSYWGADWERAIQELRQLYQIMPAYKDVSARLYQAQVTYAGLLEEAGQWCEAATWYEGAMNLQAKPEIVTKRDQMADYCERNVPPPTLEGEAGTAVPPVGGDATPQAEGADSEALRALGLSGVIYYSVWDDTRREYVLYAIGADGTGKREIAAGMHQPQVNPSGTGIIVRARSKVDTLGLYYIDLTTGTTPAMHRVTSHVDDLYPSFSPDGKSIVFASNRMSQRLWTLFFTTVSREAEPQAFVQGHTPAWSPDGTQIAFKGCDETGNQCGIYVIGTDGSGKHALVLDPSAGFPAWSPDGSRLAFMSSRDGNWEIYLVGKDGQGLSRLTNSLSSEGLPAWSPDGTALTYLSDSGGSWGIYLHRLQDGRTARLTALNTRYEDWLMEHISWGPALTMTGGSRR